MADETSNVPEQKPSYLDEVKALAQEMKKTKEETALMLEEIKKIKAEDILAGKAPQPKQEEKVEENPVDYLNKVLKGKF